MCSIHFHHVHSLLLGVCSSLPEPHNYIFSSFLAPPLAQRAKQPSLNSSAGTGSNISSRDLKQPMSPVDTMKQLFPGNNFILYSWMYYVVIQHTECLVTHTMFSHVQYCINIFGYSVTTVHNSLSMTIFHLQFQHDSCSSEFFYYDYRLLTCF